VDRKLVHDLPAHENGREPPSVRLDRLTSVIYLVRLNQPARVPQRAKTSESATRNEPKSVNASRSPSGRKANGRSAYDISDRPVITQTGEL
jgi:hypothetical protein